jgi:hypothetical protein
MRTRRSRSGFDDQIRFRMNPGVRIAKVVPNSCNEDDRVRSHLSVPNMQTRTSPRRKFKIYAGKLWQLESRHRTSNSLSVVVLRSSALESFTSSAGCPVRHRLATRSNSDGSLSILDLQPIGSTIRLYQRTVRSDAGECGNLSSSVWFEYKITIDDYPDWKSRPYR